MTLAKPNEHMDTLQIQVFVVAKGDRNRCWLLQWDWDICDVCLFSALPFCLCSPHPLKESAGACRDTVHVTHLPPEPPVAINSYSTILYGEL